MAKKPQSKTLSKKKIKRQVTRRVEATEDGVDALVARLRGFLDRNLRTILRDLESGKYTAKEAAKALGGLESAMLDAGLKDELQRMKTLFAREWEAVKDEFETTAGKKALLSNFTRQNLDAIADDRLELSGKMVEKYIGDVRSVVLDSILAGKPPEVDKVLEDAGDRVFHNLKTEIRTTLMAYNRVTHIEKAKKANITKFLYVGPDDDVTRPFCQERVDQIFTLDEIESWDNEQGLPASIYLGGYNCRHSLRPLSDDLASEMEAETTEETDGNND